MPRWDPNRTPKLCFHRGSGQYYATFDGEEVYFGTGKKAAEAEHRRLAAEWLANGRRLPKGRSRPSDDSVVTVNQVAKEFMQYAGRERFVKNGATTSEFGNYTLAFKPLCELYGHLPASAFTM